MVDLLIEGGTVVTQNADREVIDDGAVAVDDGRIVAVGAATDVTAAHDADRVVDATDHAVIPGLIDGHAHVSDVLLRGRSGTDRDLYDWIYNVKRPGMAAMSPDDHALAAALFCREALGAGITTVVETDGEVPHGDRASIEAKLAVYESAGLRNIYARGVRDRPPGEAYEAFVGRITAREPAVDHPDLGTGTVDTDVWIEEVGDLLADYHGSAGGRQEVWVAPMVVEAMTDRGLRESYRLAERHDVTTTIHVAEAPKQDSGTLSSVEYLRNVDCLGEHALLAHCVQVDDRDLRILADTDTRVAHNVASNLRLGNGVAPIPEMIDRGIGVCVGTDNAILSDTVNVLSDLRVAALVHAGHRRDPGVLTPQTALDLATIEGARAIRKGDELGSLEPGKKADVAVLDLERPNLVPAPDVVSALVYQTLGAEVETVVCDGEVVVEDGAVVAGGGEATGVTAAATDLYDRARSAADRIAAESGIDEG